MQQSPPAAPQSRYTRRQALHAAFAACALGGPAGRALAATAAMGANVSANAGLDVRAIVAAAAADYLAAPGTAAVSVGVVTQGQRLGYHFGALGGARPRPPDDATLYPIASISKTFVGALLAQAALEQRLHLDDDLRRHLDGDYPNLAFEGQPIRLHHLLSHRSGLPFILPNPPEAAPDFDDPRPFWQRVDQIVERSSRQDFYAALRQVTLTQAPGAKFQYSNAAAQLAGYVLERVYSRPLASLLKEKITTRLAMPDTAITLTPAQQARLAPGYDEQGRKMPPGSTRFQGAGALKSTLPDMLRYAAWQLRGDDPAVALSHTATYRNEDFSIGLNWQMLREGGRDVIWQDGAIPGYASFCVLQPQLGLALVILSNTLGPDTLGRLSTLVNRILHEIDARSVTKP